MNIAQNESTRIMHALQRDGFERRCLAVGLRDYDLAEAARWALLHYVNPMAPPLPHHSYMSPLELEMIGGRDT